MHLLFILPWKLPAERREGRFSVGERLGTREQGWAGEAPSFLKLTLLNWRKPQRRESQAPVSILLISSSHLIYIISLSHIWAFTPFYLYTRTFAPCLFAGLTCPLPHLPPCPSPTMVLLPPHHLYTPLHTPHTGWD